MRSPSAGRLSLWLRRWSGLVVLAYLLAYVLQLRGDGARTFLGDLGRARAPGFVALELAMIFVVSLHALDATAHVLVEWLGSHRRRALVLGLCVVAAATMSLVHLLWLVEGPP